MAPRAVVPLAWVSLRVSFHLQATEDESRVPPAIAEMLGMPWERFSAQKLDGYYGNRIARYHAHLLGEEAKVVAERILTSLGPRDREQVAADLPKRIDDHGHLFLRLDKQLLVLGRWGLSDVDAVRVEFKPRQRPREQVFLDAYRACLA